MLGPDEAEVAFVVRDREQHHGVGSALLAGIVAGLRARGVRSLRADTMWQNAAMFGAPERSRNPAGRALRRRCSVDGDDLKPERG